MSTPHACLQRLILDLAALTSEAARTLAQAGARAPLENAMGDALAACAYVREQLGLNGIQVAARAEQALTKLQEQGGAAAAPSSRPQRPARSKAMPPP